MGWARGLAPRSQPSRYLPRIDRGLLLRCHALCLLHPTSVNWPRCGGLGFTPLLFAELKAQGQERRHGRRRRRRRYRDVPSASFRQTFCLNRGNPTQEGEQVGDKTFGVICQGERVFPKSLAKPSQAKPSRAAAAKPRRGRGPRVLHGEAMLIRRVTPHPNPLPEGERVLTVAADDYASLIDTTRLLAPYLSPARGEGIVAADDYAPLIDPTGLLHPVPHPVVGEVHSRCLVPHPPGC